MTKSLKLLSLIGALGLASALGAADKPKHTFTIGENDFLLDGQRFQIRCGEVHAPRVPREYWRHRLQMTKAMGLNTVCAYLFWNMHEPRPGQFVWNDEADAAEFCRIAQEEGLWVILRPGPYACAEWEMGGFPWWLLKNPDIKLRTSDPVYIKAVQNYMKEVGRVLTPLQVTKGGPILMVQVENEYGFFGKDASYMGVIRQSLIESGFDVPLFACNPPQHLKDGYRADLFPVVNFGTNPANGFKALREILPKGPLMCGEFYPGWFDTWGAPHHTGNTQRYLTDLEYMLKEGASFSIYMAHGGTSFGLWSGADRPFKPDTSSYDYDAPISEAGWATEKFGLTKDLMAKYLLPGESIPQPPAANPVKAIASFKVTEFAPIFGNLPTPVTSPAPRNMEAYDQAKGFINYRTTIPAGPEAMLSAKAVHDYGFIYIDGQRVGFMDRRAQSFKVKIPARSKPAQLDILVESVGRVNFGVEVHDRKGLHGPVAITTDGVATELTNWSAFNFDLANGIPAKLRYGAAPTEPTPGFWRASLVLEEPADTFLDVRDWGKGVVWINGKCLGRFWNIGPTQTMYVPGPWLKKGANEIVVLDFLGPVKAELAGLEKPILDELRPKLDFVASLRPPIDLKLDGVTPAHSGKFTQGTTMQEVMLATPIKGRHFCLETSNSYLFKATAAIAELDLLDADGKPLNHEGWTIAHVSSEERTNEDGIAENVIDGQTANYWISQYSGKKAKHPHRIIIDLGKTQKIGGFRYTPRQGDDETPGRIKEYKVYVGDALFTR